MPPAARILAEWAARLRAEDIPASVRENAALRVLDTLGCALAGAREDHVPAVLALAESEHLTGQAALTALVAGYEAMIRIGMAAPGRFHERGWHATAVCGAFGAALAAGKSVGLDASRLTAALGIAGSMASGVMEFLEDGSWVKRLHPGWAAQSGIQAAALAQEGFTGPATALEGRLGFYRAALGDVPDIAKQLKNLGA